jgi:hypothetical protein
MTSKITFSNIKHIIVKSSSEITDTERSSGKLYARSIINRLAPGLKIDVLVLKYLDTLICDCKPFSVYEDDIREGTRRTFKTLSQTYTDAGKLPVSTDFFKHIKEGDTVIIFLHKVKP